MSQQQPSYAPQAAPKKRHGCRNTFLAFCGAVVLIIIVIVAAVSTSGGGGSSGGGKATAAKCSSYPVVSTTTWGQITKDPDKHAGQCLTVYGEVDQFDSATGNSAFRASSGRSYQAPQYGFADYQENSMFKGTSSQLNNVVQGDLFTAKVSVNGHSSYSNVMGGGTTVPEFQVHSIKVTGHLNQ